MDIQEKITRWNEEFSQSTPERILQYFLELFGERVALASSLGLEDQVLTDMVLSSDRNAKIFTLDTGRLFPETYSLIDKTNMRYGVNMQVYFPDSAEVEQMVNRDGVNSFYTSVEHRRQCCAVRKIGPLKRAFQGLDAWICGLRRDQSVTRSDMRRIEWDEPNGLIKINPLIDWSHQQVLDYIKANEVPYNILHDRGYPSIGCQPCTRAISDGEDIRAGRWWWESPDHKECGLHKR